MCVIAARCVSVVWLFIVLGVVTVPALVLAVIFAVIAWRFWYASTVVTKQMYICVARLKQV